MDSHLLLNMIAVALGMNLPSCFGDDFAILVWGKSRQGTAQWLERQNSNLKTLGSTPWRGRVKDSFSIPPSPLVQSCLCLIPLHVYNMHPYLCAC